MSAIVNASVEVAAWNAPVVVVPPSPRSERRRSSDIAGSWKITCKWCRPKAT